MNTERQSLRERARIHAALGDPARLAIVDALSLGDASPGGIAQDLQVPTNLVAHHVKVLADGGPLERTRSEADKRRTYLRLRPETLALLTPPRLPDTARVVDDLVIAVCDSAHEDLTASVRPRLHWSVPDPVRADTDAAFENAFTDLAGRIERLAPTLIGDPS